MCLGFAHGLAFVLAQEWGAGEEEAWPRAGSWERLPPSLEDA